jgi:hypothetical protein
VKYLCLGYQLSDAPQAPSDACAAYEETLWSRGIYLCESVAPGERGAATTLHFDGRQVTVADGPAVTTPVPLAIVMVIEADDLNHAIQLVSQSPRMRTGGGTIEIRPVDDEASRRSTR